MMLICLGGPEGKTRRPDVWNSGQMGIQTGWLDRPDG
jgi:hypothetical protein